MGTSLRRLRGSRWLPALLFVHLLFLCGCGDGRPRRVPVSGQVLIDGKPLGTGFIRLVPDDSRLATGTIDKQGRFRLTTFDPDDGCVLGTHQVEVTAIQTMSPTKIRYLVPKKYQQASTSGLSVKIDGPTDSLVIKLSWEGGAPFVEESDAGGDVDPARMN